MRRDVTPGVARQVHVVDCDNLPNDLASRHVLAELRRHAQTRPAPSRPMPLELLEIRVPQRQWMQPPKPRPGRVLAIQYQRTHHRARALCRALPFLAPLVRRIF